MDRFESYKQECVNRLVQAGFPATITPDQALEILQPSDAPENYYCDGEISQAQAFSSWKQRLRNAGLTESLIRKAVKYIFG